MEIKIKYSNCKPNIDNENMWDYPVEELDYIFESIENGDMENGSTFIFYDDRLYEVEV